jgi:hypothetical protein
MDRPDDRDEERSEGAALPMAIVAIAVAVALSTIGIAAVTRPAATPRPIDAVARSIEPSPVLGSPVPPEAPPSIPPLAIDGRPPTVGSIAAVDEAGALAVIGPSGATVRLTEPGERTIGFPAWSPDGAQIAAVVGRDATSTVEVFPVDPGAGTADPPIALYRSALQGAFYVAWTPGGNAVSFLATDADVVDLRVAGVDRAAPIDETDSASLIRRGSPLFFDWIDEDRLLAHVGVGDGAFLGELRRDGAVARPALTHPGAFRSPQVSADGRWVGWVRAGEPPAAGQVVVAPRDGGRETTLAVFGSASVAFAPTGSTVASVGADAPGQRALDIPLGPLRLIEPASGTARTLVSGAVVASFWSPDARTILAIRVQPGSGATAAASPSAVPTEVHALFVDVASGVIRADRVIQPGPRFVSELLPYFDQYELSHHLWAPDSSSFLLPIVADDGRPTVVALPRDGGEPVFTIGAPTAFWSP